MDPATLRYIEHVRRNHASTQPYIEAEPDDGSPSIILMVHNATYGYEAHEAPPTLTYNMARGEAANLAIALLDALQASLERTPPCTT